GAVPFTAELLEVCPDLKIVLYAAGTTKHLITDAFRRTGAKLCSAVHLNAVPVAEFTLGIILTSLKDVFVCHQNFLTRGRAAWTPPRRGYTGGYFHTKIGLVGFGEISKRLMELLKNFEMDVYIASNYVTPQEEAYYGVRKASLDFIMTNCDVVSIHSANVPRNHNLINKDNLKLMKKGARLINTARGVIVNTGDLTEKLSEGEITAYLDVTDPEPLPEGHPLYSMENCIITPHASGSCGKEVHRMSEYCLRELLNWLEGRPLENEIQIDDLAEKT
ncbi:MAG: hydroxyacid dehydrogenase, partial [Planctomycetota bacterium]|nr:hydroxyacid dehydrogenase [Planctomycetota bacterium]